MSCCSEKDLDLPVAVKKLPSIVPTAAKACAQQQAVQVAGEGRGRRGEEKHGVEVWAAGRRGSKAVVLTAQTDVRMQTQSRAPLQTSH